MAWFDPDEKETAKDVKEGLILKDMARRWPSAGSERNCGC
jgi:hypothetical protein